MIFFFQHLTDLLYRVVIKEEYPIIERDTAVSSDTSRQGALTYEERNVLRYVGGYMLRALMKLCLTELLEESGEDEEYNESTDWISIVISHSWPLTSFMHSSCAPLEKRSQPQKQWEPCKLDGSTMSGDDGIDWPSTIFCRHSHFAIVPSIYTKEISRYVHLPILVTSSKPAFCHFYIFQQNLVSHAWILWLLMYSTKQLPPMHWTSSCKKTRKWIQSSYVAPMHAAHDS